KVTLFTAALTVSALAFAHLADFGTDQVAPAKTSTELAEPQVDIVAKHYKVESISCKQMCFAKVKADEYDIFVEFRFDDASVDGTNILNVVRFDEIVNAHIDYYEIVKINAAIAGSVR